MAGLEGLVFQTIKIIQIIESCTNSHIGEINAVGGGSRLIFLQQLKANLQQKPVNLFDVDEATLAGCASLGAIACGDIESIEDASKIFTKRKASITPTANLTSNNQKYESFDSLCNEMQTLAKSIPIF